MQAVLTAMHRSCTSTTVVQTSCVSLCYLQSHNSTLNHYVHSKAQPAGPYRWDIFPLLTLHVADYVAASYGLCCIPPGKNQHSTTFDLINNQPPMLLIAAHHVSPQVHVHEPVHQSLMPVFLTTPLLAFSGPVVCPPAPTDLTVPVSS